MRWTLCVYLRYRVAINGMEEAELASGVLGFVLEGIGVTKQDLQVDSNLAGRDAGV